MHEKYLAVESAGQGKKSDTCIWASERAVLSIFCGRMCLGKLKKEGSFYLFIFANKAGRFDLIHTSVHVQKVMIRVTQNPVYFFGLYFRRWSAALPRLRPVDMV